MDVEAYPEDDQQEYDHGPELTAPPLGETQLGEELADNVVELLPTLLLHVTLSAERPSGEMERREERDCVQKKEQPEQREAYTAASHVYRFCIGIR